LTSMLVYLDSSKIFKFYRNLGCIYKFNIKGLLTWSKTRKKVFLCTFLLTKSTYYSFGSWHLTRKDNNIPCLNFCNRKHKCGQSIVENDFNILKKTLWKILYKIDLEFTLVLDVSCVVECKRNNMGCTQLLLGEFF
jgi:hypothetical protein